MTETGLTCADNRLSTVSDLQLAEDDRHVVADRLDADAQLLGDAGVG